MKHSYSTYLTTAISITLGCFIVSYLSFKASALPRETFFMTSVAKAYAQSAGPVVPVHFSKNIAAKDIETIDLQAISTDVRFESTDGDNIGIKLEGNYSFPNLTIDAASLLSIANDDGYLSIKTNEPELGDEPTFNINTLENDGKLTVLVPKNVAQLAVRTVSGNIHIRLPELQIFETESISGNIRIEDNHCKELHVKSVSGDLTIDGVFNELNVKTVSGNVSVQIQNANPNIEIKTTSGTISTNFNTKPDVTVAFSSMTGSLQAADSLKLPAADDETRKFFKLGTGNGKLSVKTVSGDFKIR